MNLGSSFAGLGKKAIIRDWTRVQAVEEEEHDLVGCSAQIERMRNQDKTMEIPSSFRYSNNNNNQPDQDSATKSTIHEDTVLNPSPDRNQTHKRQQNTNSRRRRDPDTTLIPSQPEPASAISAAAATTIRYRECQKNHAAHMGSHVVDGCGEFMPNGEEGTPEAMRCAACNCHRNFHRKEVDDGGRGGGAGGNGGGGLVAATPNPPSNCYIGFNTSNPVIPTKHTAAIYHPSPFQQAPSIHHYHNQRISHHPPGTWMAFGDGGGGGSGSGALAESSSEDLNMFRSDGEGYGGGGGSSRKRFRTKFTQEQKEKMMEFAQKIGWRIQKQDEDELQRFCSELGVKKQVFKVWMHNNKQAMKRKQS